jgi:hypothetical protein
MKNSDMLFELMNLPDPDLITPSNIGDPIGSGCFYRADTVVKLLMKERKNANQNNQFCWRLT